MNVDILGEYFKNEENEMKTSFFLFSRKNFG